MSRRPPPNLPSDPESNSSTQQRASAFTHRPRTLHPAEAQAQEKHKKQQQYAQQQRSPPAAQQLTFATPPDHTYNQHRTNSPPLQGGGYNPTESGAGYEQMLDAQGLSTTAVQLNIQRSKVKMLGDELNRAKQEMREMQDRINSQSSKLREEKIENSNLTHKYNEVLSKLTGAEADQRRLEDRLFSDSRELQDTRDAFDHLRNQLKAREEAFDSQMRAAEARMRRQQEELDSMANGVPTHVAEAHRTELQILEERYRRDSESIHSQFNEILDRLIDAREEDEPAVYKARSTTKSVSTELEAKLLHTESHLSSLAQQFEQISLEDQEINALMTYLMNENKELWSASSRLQLELDHCRTEVEIRERKLVDATQGGLKDEVHYLREQKSVLEQQLYKFQDLVETQKDRESDLEKTLEQLRSELRIRENRIESALDDHNKLLKENAEWERRAEEEAARCTRAVSQAEELQRQLSSLQRKYDTTIREEREEREHRLTEARQAIRMTEIERDDAVTAMEAAQSELMDAAKRVAQLERDNNLHSAEYDKFKYELERAQNAYSSTLQTELGKHRQMYEDRIAEIQNQLAEKSQEVYATARDIDDLRGEKQTLTVRVQALELELQSEREQRVATRTAFQRMEMQINESLSESDGAKNARREAEDRATAAEVDNTRLKGQLDRLEAQMRDDKRRFDEQRATLEQSAKEAERQRHALFEQVRSGKQRNIDEQTLTALRQKMERDREQMELENQRLQQQYLEVERKNAQLQSQLQTVRQRADVAHSMQEEVANLQGRLEELPSLRKQLDELQRESRAKDDEVRRLRRENSEIAEKLELYLEETRKSGQRDLELARSFGDAYTQLRVLSDQVDQVGSAARSRASRENSPHTVPERAGTTSAGYASSSGESVNLRATNSTRAGSATAVASLFSSNNNTQNNPSYGFSSGAKEHQQRESSSHSAAVTTTSAFGGGGGSSMYGGGSATTDANRKSRVTREQPAFRP